MLEVLREGDLEIVGRIVGSSNNAMLVTVTRVCPDPEPTIVVDAIYKPTLGERPLDDFPDGTLARREVAAWHVSEASGWGIVPPTILRDGPFGEGMVQAFVEADPDVDVVAMVVEDDPRLRRMAVLDAVMNNTDRKGGHILPVDGGRHVYGVDHGVDVLAGAEAADGAVGLARDAARARRDRGPRAGPRRARRRARRDARRAAVAARGPGDGPPDGRAAARPGGFPYPVAGLAGHPLAAVLTVRQWRTICAEVAMRRWNGWGDESVETSLPPRARDLLESLIGPGTPPRDATLDEVAATVPPSRLAADPRRWTTTRGRASGTPADRACPTGSRSGPDGSAPSRTRSPGRPTPRRSAASWRSAERTGAALLPYGGGTSVVGGVTARPSDRPLADRRPGRDGRPATRSTRRAGSRRSGPARRVRRSRRPSRRTA